MYVFLRVRWWRREGGGGGGGAVVDMGQKISKLHIQDISFDEQ